MVWVGTNGGGLRKVAPEMRVTERYSTEEGLPDDVVYGILRDEFGRLWLSTKAGLCTLDPETREVLTFTLEDGLQSLEFNANAYHKGPSGTLYFGGVEGLNAIKPKKLRLDPHAPAVAIVSVAAGADGSRPAPLGEAEAWPRVGWSAVKLDRRRRGLTVNFTGLNFAAPLNNRYAYKIQQLGDEWIDLGRNHTVTLADLQPGHYTLLLKAANSDGVWGKPSSLEIEIAPAPWATWWAKCLIVAAIGALAMGAHRWRTKLILERNRQLEQYEAELREKLRFESLVSNISSNLVDPPASRIDEVIQNALKEIATFFGADRVVIRLARSREDLPSKVFAWGEGVARRALVKVVGEILANALNRKRAFEALRRSQQKYWTILENVTLGISLVGKDMRVLECNRRMRQWFPGVGRGKSFCNHNADRPPCPNGERCPLRRTLADGKTHEISLGESRLGKPARFRVVTTQIKGPQKDVAAAIALVEDVTERYELENQLRHAQKMEAIGRLAGGIAHDFNNLLFALLGYADLAKAELPEDSAARDYLSQIETAGRRAAELVQQILTFSRRSGEKPEPTLVQDTVREALRLLRGSIPSTVEIAEEISRECRPVLAKASDLNQVLVNLCTNAYHALPGGKGRIEVSVKEVEVSDELASRVHRLRKGSYVVITVRDDGTGMDPEVQQRIFEPYFTTKSPGKGTGLGLSTVHGIVTKIGGAITVESAPGKGSTFKVYPPVCERSQARRSEKELGKTGSGEPARIMFVDDEKLITDMAENLLAKLGHKVTVFQDSVEAVEAFTKNPDEYDIVICDITMPKLTGLEVADRIRAIRKEVPILLTTGYSEALTEEALKELGIERLIWKPIDTAEFAAIVREVLRARRAGRKASRQAA